MPIYSNELISLIFTVLGFLSVILFGVFGFAAGDEDDEDDEDDDKKKKKKKKEEDDEDDEDEDDEDDEDKVDKKKRDVYEHQLREEAKKYRLKLKKIEEEKETADKKKLVDDGKFKELSEKTEEEKKEILENFKQKMVNVELMTEGRKAKIIDEELAVLANRDKIEVDDDFKVTGAADAIKALKESKPKYFQKEDDDEDEDEDASDDEKNPEESKKPGLKNKIFKPLEKSSRQSIADGLKKRSKKGKKDK